MDNSNTQEQPQSAESLTNTEQPVTPNTPTGEVVVAAVASGVQQVQEQTPAGNTPTPPSSDSSQKRKFPIALALLGFFILGGLSYVSYSLFTSQPIQSDEVMKLGATEKKEKLIIGTDATYPPMESIDPKTKTPIGFDIDLGNKIAGELGMNAEFVVYTWDDIFKALEEGKIDAIMSSVTINEERKEKYLFSEPYINAGQVVVVSRNASNAATVLPEQLRGRRVGVQKDTTSEIVAQELLPIASVVSYKDALEAANDLTTNKIDAMFIDLTAAKGLIEQLPSLRIASDPFTKEEYGVVFNKNNQQLEKKVSEVIKSLKERGIVDNIKQQWFQ